MNKTKIGWENPKEGWKLDVTLNPIVGCKHGCVYCYAEKLHNMRHRAYLDGKLQNIPQYAKPFNQPQFLPERLYDPYRTRPYTIFVGSMSDVFGDWVPEKWIKDILWVALENPHHRFLFLTKNPKRYLDFFFPENCWLGTTIDYQRHYKRTDPLRECKNKTFVSVEPLLSDMSDVNFKGIDLVIVGAETGPGAAPPKKEWIQSIQHDNIFYKSNIKTYL